MAQLTCVLFRQQPLRQEGACPRRQGPAWLTDLPALRLSGVSTLSHSSPVLQSVLGHGRSRAIPVLRPLKCVGANQKVVIWPAAPRGTPCGPRGPTESLPLPFPDRHQAGRREAEPEAVPPARDREERWGTVTHGPHPERHSLLPQAGWRAPRQGLRLPSS